MLCNLVDCVARQAPLSTAFSRQEYQSRSPFLPARIFLTQGSNLGLLHCRQVSYHLSHREAWPKEKDKEMETFKSHLDVNLACLLTLQTAFSFSLRHVILSHFLTYCQDYSNCFVQQLWKQKGKRGRIENFFLSTFFFFFLSPFKGTSGPREIVLGLEEIRTALGWEGVGLEREWRPFLCMVFLSLKCLAMTPFCSQLEIFLW